MGSLILMALVATGATCGALVWRRRAAARALRREHQRIEGPAPTAIARVDHGPVTIRGQAVALETVLAPTSQRRVIGYCVTTELWDPDESNWRWIHGQTTLDDFLVQDHSGRARVAAASSKGRLHLTLGTPPADAPKTPKMAGDQPLSRSRELLLCEGDEVMVTGVAGREVDPVSAGAGYREAPVRFCIAAGAGPFPLIIRAGLPLGARTAFRF